MLSCILHQSFGYTSTLKPNCRLPIYIINNNLRYVNLGIQESFSQNFSKPNPSAQNLSAKKPCAQNEMRACAQDCDTVQPFPPSHPPVFHALICSSVAQGRQLTCRIVHFTVACQVDKPLNRSEAKGDLVINDTNIVTFKCKLLCYQLLNRYWSPSASL